MEVGVVAVCSAKWRLARINIAPYVESYDRDLQLAEDKGFQFLDNRLLPLDYDVHKILQ